ncbi:Scramblase-domain-containing protein [Paraphysoderma sedebokerense]|nr:Scramblase-domain-containing protein [Paraphysoderma sedebokerense]
MEEKQNPLAVSPTAPPAASPSGNPYAQPPPYVQTTAVMQPYPVAQPYPVVQPYPDGSQPYPPQQVPQQTYPQQYYPPQQGYPVAQQPYANYPNQPPFNPTAAGQPTGQFPPQQQIGNPLDIFLQTPAIYISQKLEALEVILGWEQNNGYKCYPADKDENPSKTPIAVAKEKSGILERQCLGRARPFKLSCASPATGAQIITVNSEMACGACIGSPRVLKVYAGDFKSGAPLLGFVKEKFRWFKWEFRVKDPNNQPLYFIKGSMWAFGNYKMKIHDTNGQVVGYIKKKWRGFLKEMFTDADKFVVMFPDNSSPQNRALLFAAAFAIDVC